jgi:hypothetical protein
VPSLNLSTPALRQSLRNSVVEVLSLEAELPHKERMNIAENGLFVNPSTSPQMRRWSLKKIVGYTAHLSE